MHALNAGFFQVNPAAADANDYIVYNKATGVLSYDNDGNGAHAAIAFAVLQQQAGARRQRFPGDLSPCAQCCGTGIIGRDLGRR